MSRVVAIIGFVAVLIAGAVHSWLPALTDRHELIASSPGVEPLFSRADIAVARGQSLCIAPVLLTPDTRRVQMKVDTARGSARHLEITVQAPGYRSARRVEPVPAQALLPISVTIAPPPRTVDGRICLVNHGHRQVSVLATNEAQSLTISLPTLNGRTIPGRTASLLLLEGRSRSLGDQLSVVFDRASQLTGGFMPVWLLWPLTLVLLVGVPVGAGTSLWLSLRGDASRPQ